MRTCSFKYGDELSGSIECGKFCDYEDKCSFQEGLLLYGVTT
jgi:hypothetical protein